MRLRKDRDKRLDLVSYGAWTPADVDTLAERLGRSGVRRVNEPAALPTVGGGHGFRFFDRAARPGRVSAWNRPAAARRHPGVYDVSEAFNQDRWGTANPFGDQLAKESFNDVDRGLFVAPPV
ncbi:hypothetical protein MXD59_02155 [Frankia sp. Ag45/Mut15]|uniref:Uncharacterized protein n=1 Tax=Frankia umida TaxID=573489 RepID=A0ABT0JSQ3_9ACTN|nr:hypothetical protein [Frankia umida]MCK9874595.1 hypothetical protein [Frankia umida]